jgi:hypothetical protein
MTTTTAAVRFPPIMNLFYAIVAVAVITGTALILLSMGRVAICKCGAVEIWHGTVHDSGNSQHLTDWYTPSHVIHGFIFYGAAWLFGYLRGRQLPVGVMLLVALGVECIWEVLENTDMTIQRYRATNIALDYYGDSVLNSVSDIAAMVLGFFLARLWPVWLTLAVALSLEVFVGYMIRDNLILNVIMLLHPIDAINQWQAGG